MNGHITQCYDAMALICSWSFTGGHGLFFSAVRVLSPGPEPQLSLLIRHSGLLCTICGHLIPVISGYFRTPRCCLPYALPLWGWCASFQRWICFIDGCGSSLMRNLLEIHYSNFFFLFLKKFTYLNKQFSNT